MNLKKCLLPAVLAVSVLVVSAPKAKADAASASTQLTSANTTINTFAENQMGVYGGILAFVGGCGIAAKVRSSM